MTPLLLIAIWIAAALSIPGFIELGQRYVAWRQRQKERHARLDAYYGEASE